MHQHGSDGGLSSAANQWKIKGIFVCTNRFFRSTTSFERLLNPDFNPGQG